MTCTQNTDRECREEDCCLNEDDRCVPEDPCLNRPIVVKYINEIMPVISSHCAYCHVELFRSMKYQTVTLHKSLCMVCILNIELDARSYHDLMKKYHEACEKVGELIK
jgi:hypothetical protein